MTGPSGPLAAVVAGTVLVLAACATADQGPAPSLDSPAVGDEAATDEAATDEAASDPGESDAAAAVAPAPASALGETTPPGLFVRVEDVLDDAELAALRAVEGVEEVWAARSDDVALFASATRDGTPVDALPPRFKVSLAAVVADSEVTLSASLAPGEVALTSSALAQRALDVGSTLVLTDDRTYEVVEIVDDPALESVELLLHPADADRLDVRPRQRAIIDLAPGTDADVVAETLRTVLGDEAIVRERQQRDGRPFVLSLVETKRLFGEFAFRDLPGRDIEQGASFVDQRITRRSVPILGEITCHEAMFDPLIAALDDVWDAGLAAEIDPDLYGGCWAPRRIGADANLSRHAWGIAIDINVDFDEPGGGPIPSPGVIEAFEANGFRWGGDYPVPDNHHFELVSLP